MTEPSSAGGRAPSALPGQAGPPDDGSDRDPASSDRARARLAHAINDPLAALIGNLDLAVEALQRANNLAPEVGDVLELLRDARQSADRIGSVAGNIQPTTMRRDTRGGRLPPVGVPALGGDRRERRTRILVVDDERVMGSVLVRSFRRHEVVAVEEGKEAVDRLLRGERYDLIFCDLMMPGLTGMDLYEEVVRIAPDQAQRMVFMTAGAITTRARDFVATTPNPVITKPFSVQRLRELIRERSALPDGADGRVVVANDAEAERKLFVEWLSTSRLVCVEERAGRACVDALLTDPDGVDALVLDTKRLGTEELQTIHALKADPSTTNIPIIMVTAEGAAESDVARALEAGATFHVARPISRPLLVAKVRAACARARSERQLRARLQFAEEHATTDALTGLMNRRGFDGRLAETMANTDRHREPVALVMLDLDHFKEVNDSLGHVQGDQILLYFARALRRSARIGDQAFRYGGEEFALILPRSDVQGARIVASRVQGELRARRVAADRAENLIVTFSAGIATAEASNGFRIEDLVARADAALYQAKRKGRDRIEVEP